MIHFPYYILYRLSILNSGDNMKAEYRDYYEVLGLNVAYYRRYAHYSQTELADKVGIEQPHLSKIENASVGISMDLLFRIADALEVEPYLLLKVRD